MHQIRLAGPWELTPLEPPGPSRRIRLPADWAEIAQSGEQRVRLRRSFHKPTGLEPDDRVFLSMPFRPDAISLDNEALPISTNEDGSTSDLTDSLAGFHVLDLDVTGPAATNKPICLMIHNSSDGD